MAAHTITEPIKEIVYFGDPMCSWCWGFSPVIREIDAQYRDMAPLRIVVGGLHAGDTEPMSDAYKATIRHHWEDVNKATGATFDYSFFDREGFVLDTEPACRAAVTVREMAPEKTLEFYESVSRSFYSENKDTTDIETFKALAIEADLDAEEFAARFTSPDMQAATQNDFRFCQGLGVSGFPTVVVRENDSLALLTAGYRPFEVLQPAIDGWLANGLEAQSA